MIHIIDLLLQTSITFTPPETPAQFNDRIWTFIQPEIIKYVTATAGILAIKMLWFR